MTTLSGRRIVLGVTGGIAAYKAIDICRRLVETGAHVTPLLTKGAVEMVGEVTFSALASEPVRTSLFEDSNTPIPHTEMGQNADLIVVAPATARVISDIRSGRSGDLLTATILASRATLVICPAMHTEMWEQESVQENISVLRSRGVHIVDPEEGYLAGGDFGLGRLAEPTRIVTVLENLLLTGDLADKQVLVSAGGTREPIDAVRYIGNRSSGKQGHAVAQNAAERGASVVLVTTNPQQAPSSVRVVAVSTATEMHRVCLEEAPKADLVVMAAAVADFRPKENVCHKLKKSEGTFRVELEPTVDILAELGATKPAGQVLVGFAAETDDLEHNAKLKLDKKNLDIIVANDVSVPGVGFEHETNEVILIGANSLRQHLPLSSKDKVARTVLDAAVDIFKQDHEEQE